MTALDSFEHLPNHACYERKIHEGYWRKKHLVIRLDQAATGAANKTGREVGREMS